MVSAQRAAYMTRYRAGQITPPQFDDPQPLRNYLTEWVARGRTLVCLADRAGVPYRPLVDLHAGRVHRARPGLTAPALAVPLPPSNVGVARRVRALFTRGHRLEWVAAQVGVTANALTKALYRTQFSDDTAYALVAVFEAYSGTWGPSQFTAGTSISRGYRSPDAWYQLDIDDPDTVPWPGPGPAGRPPDVKPFFSPDYYYAQTGRWPTRDAS